MATDITCVRIPPDQRALLEHHAQAGGLSLSDLIRTILMAYFQGQAGSTDGYLHARALGTHIARRALSEALNNLPDTYEEAVERFGNEQGLIDDSIT